jgi:hypothetical protein
MFPSQVRYSGTAVAQNPKSQLTLKLDPPNYKINRFLQDSSARHTTENTVFRCFGFGVLEFGDHEMINDKCNKSIIQHTK